MKGIVLQAPWAPLVALGVKGYETRGFRPGPATLLPGDDLAIVLGRSSDGVWALPGDCEGKTEAGWVYGFVGDHQAGYCEHTSDEGTRGDVFMHLNVDGPTAVPDQLEHFTIGTVLAVVTYGGALPVSSHLVLPVPRLWRHPWSGQLFEVTANPQDATTRSLTAVTEQLLYGDFTPGRYGWPLTNVRRLAEPVECPARQLDGTRISMQGVFDLPDHVAATVAEQMAA